MAKLAVLEQIREHAQVDAIVVMTRPNLTYVLQTGIPLTYERTIILVHTRSQTIVLAPLLEKPRFQKFGDTLGLQTLFYSDDTEPFAKVAELLVEKPKTVLLEHGIPHSLYLRMLDAMGRPVDKGPLESWLAPFRFRKDEGEVSKVKKALELIQGAYRYAERVLKEGVSEVEASLQLTKYLIEQGADEVVYASVASGPNSAIPHHERSSRRLRGGDVVVVDLVAGVDGYYGDLTRVFVLGEPPKGFEEVYAAVNRARSAVFDKARPGTEAGRLDLVARKVLEKHGLLKAVLHRTGHGLGVEVHEPPFLAVGNSEILVEGNLFTVEPGVYLQGRFGVRIESVVWLEGGKSVVLDDEEPEPVYL